MLQCSQEKLVGGLIGGKSTNSNLGRPGSKDFSIGHAVHQEDNSARHNKEHDEAEHQAQRQQAVAPVVVLVVVLLGAATTAGAA